MTKRNRETLKKRFGDGEMPSTQDFGDLIESMLNIQDDGIMYNERDGLRLTQIGASNKVLSFYGAIEEKSAVWALGMDAHESRLTLDVDKRGGHNGADTDGGGVAVLTLLAPDGALPARVGVNQRDPRHALDVGGTIAARGRIGARGSKTALADGEWHTITDALSGCTALEVMAGVGKKGSGKYALMHAHAFKLFEAKGEFSYHHVHHDSRRHRMQLQWVPAKDQADGAYELQIRVNCPYGDGIQIQYHITELWFDPAMDGCVGGGRP